MNATADTFAAGHGGRLLTVAEAAQRIASGALLSIAGDEACLRALPRGNWIGGTIPYFMDEAGGQVSRDRVFVTALPGVAADIRLYDTVGIAGLCVDAPANGYTLLIIPAFSAVHSLYARRAPDFEDMFVKPVAGWVAGVHLDELGRVEPLVVDGRSGRFSAEHAVAIHVTLADEDYATVEIVNVMQPAAGAELRFPETGFSAARCLVDGVEQDFAAWLQRSGADLRLPLVADYCGARVNVSFKGINAAEGCVEFYAPVFDDVVYRLAAPVADYPAALQAALPAGARADFACNCILNYVHGGLEGRRAGNFFGPITFGEVAYQLLNQTLVYLHVARA